MADKGVTAEASRRSTPGLLEFLSPLAQMGAGIYAAGQKADPQGTQTKAYGGPIDPLTGLPLMPQDSLAPLPMARETTNYLTPQVQSQANMNA